MKHASHPHELHVTQNMENNNQNLTCFACKFPLFGTCYACSSCNFYLHKFCFELPQSAHFEFVHSEHTLGLLYAPHCQGPCEACGESCNGFTYNCALCNFNVHANCATLLQPDPQNYRDQYVTVYLAHVMPEMKSLRSQLASMNGKQQQNGEDAARIRNMEMEAELQRRRHNLTMQQLKQASDSINFMGQIGTSNYTYRYF